MPSEQGGVQSICVVGDCGVISGSSARDDLHCPHSLGVYVGRLSNESSCSFASYGSFGFVSLVVVVVGLTGSLSDISVSSV